MKIGLEDLRTVDKIERRGIDRVAYSLATGLGAGFIPIAPGTFGSIEGVGIFVLVLALPLQPAERLALLIALALLTFAAGVWSSTRACRMTGLKDPSPVVIDEVCGQLVALAPLVLAPSAAGVLAAFFIFRLFDIFKPYPIDRLEHLPEGFGVMSDDLLAGIYTAVVVWVGYLIDVL
jgi:phosphatidylglycerophosphatase A